MSTGVMGFIWRSWRENDNLQKLKRIDFKVCQ